MRCHTREVDKKLADAVVVRIGQHVPNGLGNLIVLQFQQIQADPGDDLPVLDRRILFSESHPASDGICSMILGAYTGFLLVPPQYLNVPDWRSCQINVQGAQISEHLDIQSEKHGLLFVCSK